MRSTSDLTTPRTISALSLALALCVVGCAGKNPDESLGDAKARAAKGERNAAIIQLKSSLQEHPDHGESRIFLGSLYLQLGDYRGAEKELRRAMELRIDPARVLPGLGKALIMQGEAKKVLAEISADLVRDPEGAAGILTMRGMAHLALRQPNEAGASFEQALGVMPGYADALLGQARLLASERKFDEALVGIDRALERGPTSAEAMMLKADLLRLQGKSDDALALYGKVVETYPDHVNGRLALVSMAVAAGRFDDATAQIDAVRKYANNNPMTSYFQALIDFRKGKFVAARDAIALVLKVAPNHLPSVLLGGAVEFALGSHELAQARLRYVLERVPSNLYARRLLIASYARGGQTHKAMELLEPVLRQGTKDPALLALAGEVHMQMDDYDKAKGYFEKAAALDPKNPAMRTSLGLSRLAAGEVDLATADLESASQLDTTSRHRADVLLISTHLQRRQYDQAMKAAQSLVQKQPDSPMSHNLLAAAHLGKKDVAAARAALERALQLQPDYVPAASNLAQIDLQKGDKKSARKRFEDIIARDKSNVQAYIALATLGSSINATQDDIRGWLETARKESPGTIQPLVMLARFYFQEGQPKKALELMEKAVVSAPDEPEVLELASRVQLAAGEKNRALATSAKLVTAQPQSATALFRLATAQLANDDANGAAVTLRKALAVRPQFPEAQFALAEAEARNGRVKEAVRVAQELQKQSPRLAAGWIAEGDAMMLDKQFAAASKAYDKAFAVTKSGMTAAKLHAALAQAGSSLEGIKRLHEWLNLQPKDLPTRLYLAEAYLKESKYPNAIQEYERIMADHPDNLVVLNNLAWCYQQTKDRRALGLAERALGLKPDNPAVMDTLGWILVENGEFQRGVDLLKKAVESAPRAPEIRLHYAQGLAKSGNVFRAREELDRLMLDFPKFSGSTEAAKLAAELKHKAPR